MRILLINWQDPSNPRAGGAEIHLHEIFRRIRGVGHEVSWLASGWEGGTTESVLDGIQIHRAGSRYTFGAASVRYYRRHLADHRFDVVVEALNKVPVYTPLWVRQPTLLLVHHLFGTTAFQEAPLPLAVATWLQERPLPRVYASAAIQTISHSTAADLVARGIERERIRVVHPGIDLDFFRPSSSPVRAVLPTFLYLGRLQKYKRVDLLLRAFALLARSMPRARLVIAGRGDQLDSLRGLASVLGVASNVHFTGYVSEEAKRNLFRTAWANVFVSPKEGWGITNLEAAACGTPTIASDSPGLRESVVDGRTGLLVPHGDLQSLSLALRRLASDPGLVEDLGRASLDFARGFSWEWAARKTLEQLQSLAGTGTEPDAG